MWVSMRRSVPIQLPLTLLLLLLLLCQTASAFDYELKLALNNRLHLQKNTIERLLRYSEERQLYDTRNYLAPYRNNVQYGLSASAQLKLEANDWFSVELAIDSGEMRPIGRLPQPVVVPLPDKVAAYLPDPIAQSTRDERRYLSNGQPFADEAEETYFIRQASLRFAIPETEWLSVEIGRMVSSVGSNLIYNDSALGIGVVIDLEPTKDIPLRFSLQALLPTRTWNSGLSSPLVELKGEYLLSFMESVGLSFTFYHDGDDNFGQHFVPSISEAAAVLWPDTVNSSAGYQSLIATLLGTAQPSDGNVFWLSLSGNKLFGDFSLAATFVLEFGSLRLGNPFYQIEQLSQSAPELYLTLPNSIPKDPVLNFDTLGFAVDLSFQYLVRESMAVGAFFLFLSGADNPYVRAKDDGYGSFLAVLPFVTHTNLFFSGGLNETFSGRQLSNAGINGRGVVALGPTFQWEPIESLALGSTAAALFSPIPSLYGGQFYGVEFDFQGAYDIIDYVRVSLEYDFLVAGDFFSREGVVHQILVGLDLSYER
jgi:hypothetical protein